MTRDEARAATRAGFRPMELHMVWNPATKSWIPEGNLPAGLRYDDEELVPDYDDGMIDIQAAHGEATHAGVPDDSGHGARKGSS